MCGIAGSFAYHREAPHPDAREIRRMTDAMATRGPDGQGLWTSPGEGRVILGHRRLAILDLSDTGAQPMLSGDGRLAITFNGEIYNHRALRQDMESRGWRFRSTSDTEVLLALWDAHGPDMVQHLRGMFAFALWDARQQSLFLARDPFGIKPLYYADDGKSLRFASQVKALMAGGGITSAPSLAAWAGFHLLGYVPEPHTVHQAIRALPAGQALLLRRDGSRQGFTHFDLRAELAAAEDQALILPASEARERLRAELADSVQAHMVSDVPVGLFLSAGLDSSTLTALAAERAPARLRALTLGFHEFKGQPEDETALAALAARHIGVDHDIRWITRADFEAHLDHALAAMDQPSIDGINTYFVSLAAAQAGMKVALSGLGGDELLAGYPSFRQVPRLARLTGPLARRWHGLGQRLRQVVAPLIPAHLSPKTAGLLEYGGTLPGAYLLRRALHMPWELPALMGSVDAARGLEELDLLGRMQHSIQGLRTDRARLMALETGWYMQGQLLKDTDWAAMAHSLEVRVPFVDIEVFRALAPLQVGAAPLGKADLAQVPAAGLPEALRTRPKTGFATPVRAWAESLYPLRAQGRRLRGWAQVIADPHPPFRPRGSKRILLLLTDGYGGHGGIAQYSRDLIEALCAHPEVGEVVALPRIMPHRPGPMPANLVWESAALGGKGHYLGALARAAHDPRGYDLILCGHLNLVPAATAISPWIRAPRAAFIYGIDAWQRPASLFSRALARTFGPIISISEITLRRFVDWSAATPRRAAILPNAIHLGDYAAGPKPDYLLSRYDLHGRPVVLTFGRMDSYERYKGFDEMLEALPELRRRIPGVAYVLAGDGSDQARLIAKADQLGVRDSVIFTGRVAAHEKADHFRMADVYAMPSRGEGFGFVVLEALACGIPIVGSTMDGTREAARDGLLGRLVHPDDRDGLGQAIAAALAEGRGAVPEGLAHFAFPQFTHRTHRLIERLWTGDLA
ncbi:MAG: asparagine synthase (glutamine-hydrolyzing) [Geothrix sp.]|nr:asparagine synthase (glutamine-hydrolyzing) [Geothrix sp.]